MKLLIIAAIVGACAAARLEHLERGYLPPHGSNGQSSFGSSNGFGSSGSHGSPAFQSSGSSGFRSSNGLRSGFHSGPSFSAAQSTQYLPPDHGPSGGSFGGSFGRSGALGGNGFGASPSSQFGGQFQSRFGSPSQQYGAPQGTSARQFGQSSHGGQNQFNGQFGSSAQSRQYLAPKQSSSFQNIPQQAFNEQTGYQY